MGCWYLQLLYISISITATIALITCSSWNNDVLSRFFFMTFLALEIFFSSNGDYPSEAYDNSFLQDFSKILYIPWHHITIIYSRCQGRSLRGQRLRSGERRWEKCHFFLCIFIRNQFKTPSFAQRPFTVVRNHIICSKNNTFNYFDRSNSENFRGKKGIW